MSNAVTVQAPSPAGPITIEVEVLRRLPGFVVTGMSSVQVAGEISDKVRLLIAASGDEMPRARIVVTIKGVDLTSLRRWDGNTYRTVPAVDWMIPSIAMAIMQAAKGL